MFAKYISTSQSLGSRIFRGQRSNLLHTFRKGSIQVHSITLLPTTFLDMVYHSNIYQNLPSQSRRPNITSTTTTTASQTSRGPNMYYLIHTSHHQRPYLSTVSFIANDFAQWGCRVTCHAKDSPYINEIRFQEKRTRPATRRIELMEVWAKEVVTRKQQARSYRSLPEFETRKERASNFVQDFICALSSFGTSLRNIIHKHDRVC